jgi:hypothetical protein
MVRGLDVFKEWFKDYSEHYVLIGCSPKQILQNIKLTRFINYVSHYVQKFS